MGLYRRNHVYTYNSTVVHSASLIRFEGNKPRNGIKMARPSSRTLLRYYFQHAIPHYKLRAPLNAHGYSQVASALAWLPSRGGELAVERHAGF